jgi:hypothetical protein
MINTKLLIYLLIGVVAVGGFLPISLRRAGGGQPEILPYTIMIYMNGSCLESEHGAATNDLAEMLDAGLDARYANVLILTGGTLEWQNAAIPAPECIVWALEDGAINEQVSLGRVSMGDPNTLRDFIVYARETRPARRYGLILWDHGGGSIAGFGHDERHGNDALTLAELEQAFHEAGLAEPANRLEFLGFDACLMASVEMAALAAPYARVMIASCDLEPADGWDYRFLRAVHAHQGFICGYALGRVITDSFIRFYGENSREALHLSVVDTSRARDVLAAMGRLAAAAEAFMECPDGFAALARARAATKTFGLGSPRDNYADMVDIGHMAALMAEEFPCLAPLSQDVHRALSNAVVHTRDNSNIPLGGLSCFYIYGGISEGHGSLKTYSALDVDPYYTAYQHSFFHLLLANPACQFQHPQSPCGLYLISETATCRHYSLPVTANGKSACLIFIAEGTAPPRPAGLRYHNSHTYQKGIIPLRPDDIVVGIYENHLSQIPWLTSKAENV